MNFSSQILRKTKRSMVYMNGYRVLRYELKGLFYLTLAVLLLLLWHVLFHDNLFRLDVWLSILIVVLVAPFIYCLIKPVRLLMVVKYLDNQLNLQQRLEMFFENLKYSDEVTQLQRKDTYDFLKSIDMVAVIKFKWPFEARVFPFVLFFIFLLFTGKGLFEGDRMFVTGLDYTKEADIKYQIVENPFKKNPQNASVKSKKIRSRINMSRTKKIYKTSAGNRVGSTGLKVSENSRNQSNSSSLVEKTTREEGQQSEAGSMKSSLTDKVKSDKFSYTDKKMLHNPTGNRELDSLKNGKTAEMAAMPKSEDSAFSAAADAAKAESRLRSIAGDGSISSVNNITTANSNGNAGIGTSSNSADATRRSMHIQHSFTGDPKHIEEMISSNSVQPSLREYVKRYFLSLNSSTDASE